MKLPHITPDQSNREQLARQSLARQAAVLLAGGLPEKVLRDAARPASAAPAPEPLLPVLSRIDALRSVWPLRKSVKALPVKTSHKAPTTSTPVRFAYHANGGQLPALRRTALSPSWTRLLTSVSTNGCAGGRVLGSQGRNLARIVEGLRARCYLRLSDGGRPVAAREQVVLVVESKGEGAAPSFARDLGMSPATFYAALRHPLAYLFLRTQKVQKTEADGARRNVATCFTVALYDPPMPEDVEQALYAESVEKDGVFAVPEYICESKMTKGNQNYSTSNEGACGKPTAPPEKHKNTVQDWENAAAMPDRGRPDYSAQKESAREGVHIVRPDLWELAGNMAVQLGERNPQAARVTYYRALTWLGYARVRQEYVQVERAVIKGRDVRNQGATLTARLNRAARAEHGFNLRDLPLNGPATGASA